MNVMSKTNSQFSCTCMDEEEAGLADKGTGIGCLPEIAASQSPLET